VFKLDLSSASIPLLRRITPRLAMWLVLSFVLVAALVVLSPSKLPIGLYKLTLISLAAVVAYWLDRALFPYARPDSYLKRDWRHGTDEPEDQADYEVVPGYELIFSYAMLRRALVVVAVVIGVALGL